MWKQPWSLREGFVIGLGLLLAGLALQLSIGPLEWNMFAFPANIFLVVILLLLMGLVYALRSRVYAFRFLASYRSAIPALAYAALLTALMGVTRQVANGDPIDPLGITRMLSFWPFILIYLWMTVIVAQATLHQLAHFHLRRLPSLVSHVGLLIVLVAATLGSADMKRVKMFCETGKPEWRALDEHDNVHELPLAIELRRFILEEYPAAPTAVRLQDGTKTTMNIATPKRFASEVDIFTQEGEKSHATIEVNRPLSVNGWKIYQYSYDEMAGAKSSYSVFELVTDPWQPIVYLGIGLLLLGALLLFIVAQKKKETV